ncbi:MAG: SpoIIE family protein phosphatase [Planctomycetota bacterium]
MAFLTIAQGVEPGKRFELDADQSIIGRSSDCQVSLDVAAVSRRHAALVQDAGRFFVEDLGSRNGTLVNGQKIVDRTPLRDGDRILVCDQELAFHQERPHGLLGDTSPGETSTLAQLVSDEENGEPASVMATLDLGGGSASSWSLSANPQVKLNALLEISNNLAQAVSVEEILPKVLDSLFKIFVQADRGFVVMRPDDDKPLVVVEEKARKKAQEEKMRISRTIVEKAMESKQAILSADAASDERFGMAQSIAEFQIRSMICAPMINSDDEAIGVLQIDTLNQRSRFTDEDLEVLAAVASQAAVAIDNARMHEQVLSQRALQRDLELAKRMQRALLPSSPPEASGYFFFDYYESARQVGGDYYDYVPLSGGRFGVVVGDVAGKGVSAAILMARLSSDVRFCLATEPDLASATMQINRLFARQDWEDRFVTMIIAVIDPNSNEMTMTNAGHMPPLLRNAGGEVSELAEEIAGLPLGVYEDYEYESISRTIEPGEFLTLFTDGFSEAMNRERELYGMERLAAAVGSAGLSVGELGQHILTDVRKFVDGYDQSDDMCLACFGRGEG